MTVIEDIDGVVKRQFNATLGGSNSFTVSGETFMKLLNGSHTMTIMATDSNNKSTFHSMTFTKAITACMITLESPMETDDLITKTVLNIFRDIPADAELQVLITNNANDDEPVWEDATSYVISGMNFLFENTTVENGHAYNFIIRAKRGPSGLGGHIGSIGGAFE